MILTTDVPVTVEPRGTAVRGIVLPIVDLNTIVKLGSGIAGDSNLRARGTSDLTTNVLTSRKEVQRLFQD